eukprot:Sspe_Gene.96286::Locus_68890_Transcript_1_2_Confidence_0.667_Length_1171::g.96286::m.96286/K01062/PLA2G7, PAFAH; platelet-activating factor acetylhydrolase
METAMWTALVGGVVLGTGVMLFRTRLHAAFPVPMGDYKRLSSARCRVPGGPHTQIFYPAEGPAPTRVEYMRTDSIHALADAMFFSGLGHVLALLMGNVTHPDGADAPPLEGSWPVIVFSHGLFGSPDMYTQLCRELASYGAVVVSVEHEDGSGTSSRAVPYRHPKGVTYSNRDEVRGFRAGFYPIRLREVEAVLRYLEDTPAAQRIAPLTFADPSRCILAGHSFGGASTVMNLKTLRPLGALLYDIWAYPLPEEADITVPALSILSSAFAGGKEGPHGRELFRRSTGDVTSYYLESTTHQLWSDFVWVLPPPLNPACLFKEHKEQHKAWVMASFAALDRYLGKKSSLYSHPLLREY